MSYPAFNWVFKNSEARLGARLLLLAIAYHASDTGETSLSIEEICRVTRSGPATVYRAIKQLVAIGELEVRPGNLYRLPKFSAWKDSQG